MIECEICGNYIHIDDMEECPQCGLELCPECYKKHMSAHAEEEFSLDIEQDEEEIIPHTCPHCQDDLTLDTTDIDMGGAVVKAYVYCDSCGFSQELDESQLAEINRWLNEDENEDCYDNDEDE